MLAKNRNGIDREVFYGNLDEFRIMLETRSAIYATNARDHQGQAGRFVDLVAKPLLSGDRLLCQCYEAHGIEHNLPYEHQSEAAQLGRKVAGVIWKIANDTENSIKKNKTIYVADDERIIAASQPKKRKRTTSKKRKNQETRTEIIANLLKPVLPGYEIELLYENEKDARNDQLLLNFAVEKAGWLDGVKDTHRPYASTIRKTSQGYRMRVIHLEEPRPRRGRKCRKK